MDKFVERQLKIIPELIESSKDIILQSKTETIKYYNTIIKLLNDESVSFIKPPEDFTYNDPIVAYSNNVVYVSFLIVNTLAKQTNYISLFTILPHKEIHIKLSGKTILIINRHLQLGINSCNKVCTKYKFINEKGSSYVPPEYYMIYKYTEYYNNEITDKIIEEEKVISEVIIKRFDLYKNTEVKDNKLIEKRKNVDELMDFFKKYCIICSFSVFKLLYPLPEHLIHVMQVISAISDDDTIEKLKYYMEKRNIKIIIEKNNTYEQEINVTCYMINNEDGYVIGKLYNYLSYQIVPYNIIQGYKICHPYINKKHLLLDYIVSYAFLKHNDLIDEIKYYYECLNKEDVKLFDNYAGTYVNPTISKKILTNKLLKEINMPGNYIPAVYYHKNKTYKIIEKQKNRCN